MNELISWIPTGESPHRGAVTAGVMGEDVGISPAGPVKLNGKIVNLVTTPCLPTCQGILGHWRKNWQMFVESFRDHPLGGSGCEEGIHCPEKCKAHTDSSNSSERKGCSPGRGHCLIENSSKSNGLKWICWKLQQIKWSELDLLKTPSNQMVWTAPGYKTPKAPGLLQWPGKSKLRVCGPWADFLQILLLQRFPPGCKAELMLKKIFFMQDQLWSEIEKHTKESQLTIWLRHSWSSWPFISVQKCVWKTQQGSSFGERMELYVWPSDVNSNTKAMGNT